MRGSRVCVIVAEIIILAVIIVFAVSMYQVAFAEDGYILCNPDSYVYVRRSPKKASEGTGQLYCGDRIETDGRTKNGYIHCINMSTEYGDGWVHMGYVVSDQPRIAAGYATVVSNGRVAARRWINGKRNAWLRNGAEIRVIAISEEWTLTARGFIKTEYLEEFTYAP